MKHAAVPILNKHRPRAAIIFVLIFCAVVLLSWNWYLRKKVPQSFAEQLSYNELYLDPQAIRIQSARTEEGKFLIQLAGDIQNMSTNIPPTNFQAKSTIALTPDDNGRQYWIKQDQNKDSIFFSINYTPDIVYKTAGSSQAGKFELRSSTLLFADTKLNGSKTWAFDFMPQPEAAGEKAKLERYLRDSMRILNTDAGVVKLEKIFSHLRPFVQPNLGVPHDSIGGKTPLEVLALLKQGRIHVWCGNLSSLAGAMTAAAGLPSRLITTEGYETFTYPVHSFNEVFLPEYRSWVYCDLTNDIAYIKVAGKPLNTLQLHRLIRSGIEGTNLKAFRGNDTAQTVDTADFSDGFKSYLTAPQQFRYYYPRYLDQQNLHSVMTRIQRLFRPRHNYAYYSDNNHYFSIAFWLVVITQYMAISLLIISAFLIYRKLSQRKR